MSEAPTERLLAIRDVGPETALHVRAFFESPHFPDLLAKLEAAGVNLNAPKADDTGVGKPFAGMTFVITGTLSQPRPHFAAQIEALGGKCSGSVSKKTNYLIAGEEAGSKLSDAGKLNIPILDEAAFEALRLQAIEKATASEPEPSVPTATSLASAVVVPPPPIREGPAASVALPPDPPIPSPVSAMPPPPSRSDPQEQLSFF